VACGANRICVSMVHGEERVIRSRQGCREPRGGGMACGARGWPANRNVIWVCGSREVRGMAGVANCRRSGENVINVAQIAGHGCVRPC